MAFKIGFVSEQQEKKQSDIVCAPCEIQSTPRKSIVQVRFPGRGASLAYYNDSFDLRRGDRVYVDGKLEGILGRVEEVNYNFKIKISDYKRVIALVDTAVHGRFYMAASHFVTFDREALPACKAASWFMPPTKEEDRFITGSDDTSFLLDDLSEMNITAEIAQRGRDYYLANKVRYISINGTEGYAVVEGSKNYEVEFEYSNGEISKLVCSCFCSFNCKHEFAAMLQLKETLELIKKNYESEFENAGYFAAVDKGVLFSFAVDGKDDGTFVL